MTLPSSETRVNTSEPNCCTVNPPLPQLVPVVRTVEDVGRRQRVGGSEAIVHGADDVVDGLRNTLTPRVWRVRDADDGLIWATPERFLKVAARLRSGDNAAPAPVAAQTASPCSETYLKGRQRPRVRAIRAALRVAFETCLTPAWTSAKGKNSRHFCTSNGGKESIACVNTCPLDV